MAQGDIVTINLMGTGNLNQVLSRINQSLGTMNNQVGLSSKALKSLGSIVQSMNRNTGLLATQSTNLANGFGSLNTNGTLTRNTLRGVGERVEMLVGNIAALTAAIYAVTTPIREFAKFEYTMAQVGAVTDATRGELVALSDAAKTMGKTTLQSAQSTAQAMIELGQAGFSARESMQALPAVMDLATAGVMNVTNATSIATGVMYGMGLAIEDFKRIGDVLSRTAIDTNTNISELGIAMSYAAPMAANLGMSIEETSAALGIMSNAGISASKAGTSLRGIIARLVDPPREAEKALAELGNRIGQNTIQLTDAEGNYLSLIEIMEQLVKANMTAGEAIAVFGQRAGPGMAALISQGIDKMREMTYANETSEGTMRRVADVMSNTLMGSFKLFNGAVKDVSLTIGELLTPSVRSFIDNATDFVNSIASAIQSNKEFYTVVFQSVAILGTAITTFAAVNLSVRVAAAAFGSLLGRYTLLNSTIGLYSRLTTASVASNTTLSQSFAAQAASAQASATAQANVIRIRATLSALELQAAELTVANAREEVARALAIEGLAERTAALALAETTLLEAELALAQAQGRNIVITQELALANNNLAAATGRAALATSTFGKALTFLFSIKGLVVITAIGYAIKKLIDVYDDYHSAQKINIEILNKEQEELRNWREELDRGTESILTRLISLGKGGVSDAKFKDNLTVTKDLLIEQAAAANKFGRTDYAAALLKAADSINEFSGVLQDNGAALNAFKLDSFVEKMKLASEETENAILKIEHAAIEIDKDKIDNSLAEVHEVYSKRLADLKKEINASVGAASFGNDDGAEYRRYLQETITEVQNEWDNASKKITSGQRELNANMTATTAEFDNIVRTNIMSPLMEVGELDVATATRDSMRALLEEYKFSAGSIEQVLDSLVPMVTEAGDSIRQSFDNLVNQTLAFTWEEQVRNELDTTTKTLKEAGDKFEDALGDASWTDEYKETLTNTFYSLSIESKAYFANLIEGLKKTEDAMNKSNLAISNPEVVDLAKMKAQQEVLLNMKRKLESDLSELEAEGYKDRDTALSESLDRTIERIQNYTEIRIAEEKNGLEGLSDYLKSYQENKEEVITKSEEEVVATIISNAIKSTKEELKIRADGANEIIEVDKVFKQKLIDSETEYNRTNTSEVGINQSRKVNLIKHYSSEIVSELKNEAAKRIDIENDINHIIHDNLEDSLYANINITEIANTDYVNSVRANSDEVISAYTSMYAGMGSIALDNSEERIRLELENRAAEIKATEDAINEKQRLEEEALATLVDTVTKAGEERVSVEEQSLTATYIHAKYIMAERVAVSQQAYDKLSDLEKEKNTSHKELLSKSLELDKEYSKERLELLSVEAKNELTITQQLQLDIRNLQEDNLLLKLDYNQKELEYRIEGQNQILKNSAIEQAANEQLIAAKEKMLGYEQNLIEIAKLRAAGDHDAADALAKATELERGAIESSITRAESYSALVEDNKGLELELLKRVTDESIALNNLDIQHKTEAEERSKQNHALVMSRMDEIKNAVLDINTEVDKIQKINDTLSIDPSTIKDIISLKTDLAAVNEAAKSVEATMTEIPAHIKEQAAAALLEIRNEVTGTANAVDSLRNLAEKPINMTAQLSNADQIENQLDTLTRDREVNIIAKVPNPSSNHLGGEIQGYRKGGRIPGYGGGDTVPAMLAPGEWVIRKEAVKKYGDEYLAGLNEGDAPKFANGGGNNKLVPALVERGEWILGKETVDKYGKDYISKINSMQVTKFASGGTTSDKVLSKNESDSLRKEEKDKKLAETKELASLRKEEHDKKLALEEERRKLSLILSKLLMSDYRFSDYDLSTLQSIRKDMQKFDDLEDFEKANEEVSRIAESNKYISLLSQYKNADKYKAGGDIQDDIETQEFAIGGDVRGHKRSSLSEIEHYRDALTKLRWEILNIIDYGEVKFNKFDELPAESLKESILEDIEDGGVDANRLQDYEEVLPMLDEYIALVKKTGGINAIALKEYKLQRFVILNSGVAGSNLMSFQEWKNFAIIGEAGAQSLQANANDRAEKEAKEKEEKSKSSSTTSSGSTTKQDKKDKDKDKDTSIVGDDSYEIPENRKSDKIAYPEMSDEEFKQTKEYRDNKDEIERAIASRKEKEEDEEKKKTKYKGYQTGGKIPGYGGGDKVPALLEEGEWVINKEASRAVGDNVLAAINSGDVQKFATGGTPKLLEGSSPPVSTSSKAKVKVEVDTSEVSTISKAFRREMVIVDQVNSVIDIKPDVTDLKEAPKIVTEVATESADSLDEATKAAKKLAKAAASATQKSIKAQSDMFKDLAAEYTQTKQSMEDIDSDFLSSMQDIANDASAATASALGEYRSTELANADKHNENLLSIAEDFATQAVDSKRDEIQELQDIRLDFSDDMSEINEDMNDSIIEDGISTSRQLEDIALDNTRNLEDIAKNHSDSMTELGVETQRDIEDLNKDSARELEDIQADIAKDALSNATDINNERIDNIRDFNRELVDISSDVQQELADVNKDRIRDLEDIEYEGNNDRIEIDKELTQTLLDIQKEVAQEYVDIEKDRVREIEDLDIEHNRTLEDLKTDSAKSLRDIEIDSIRSIEDANIDKARSIEDINSDSVKAELESIKDKTDQAIELEESYSESIKSEKESLQESLANIEENRLESIEEINDNLLEQEQKLAEDRIALEKSTQQTLIDAKEATAEKLSDIRKRDMSEEEAETARIAEIGVKFRKAILDLNKAKKSGDKELATKVISDLQGIQEDYSSVQDNKIAEKGVASSGSKIVQATKLVGDLSLEEEDKKKEDLKADSDLAKEKVDEGAEEESKAAMTETEQKLADLATVHEQQLANMAEEAAIAAENRATEIAEKLANLQIEFDRKMQDMDAEKSKKITDMEEEAALKIQELDLERQRAEEDAVIELERVMADLEATRQLKIDDAAAEKEQKLADLAEAHIIELEQLDIAQGRKLEDIEEEKQLKLAALDVEQQRIEEDLQIEIEQEKIASQELLAQKIADLDVAKQRKLADIEEESKLKEEEINKETAASIESLQLENDRKLEDMDAEKKQKEEDRTTDRINAIEDLKEARAQKLRDMDLERKRKEEDSKRALADAISNAEEERKIASLNAKADRDIALININEEAALKAVAAKEAHDIAVALEKKKHAISVANIKAEEAIRAAGDDTKAVTAAENTLANETRDATNKANQQIAGIKSDSAGQKSGIVFSAEADRSNVEHSLEVKKQDMTKARIKKQNDELEVLNRESADELKKIEQNKVNDIKKVNNDSAKNIIEITKNTSNRIEELLSFIDKSRKKVPGGYAVGGYISEGSGTKDDVPALLTRGEFVQRASAVKNYGLRFMSMLNNNRVPKALTQQMATGGYVNKGIVIPAIPKFNLGGIVKDNNYTSFVEHAVKFNIGGNVVGPFKADKLTVNDLLTQFERAKMVA